MKNINRIVWHCCVANSPSLSFEKKNIVAELQKKIGLIWNATIHIVAGLCFGPQYETQSLLLHCMQVARRSPEDLVVQLRIEEITSDADNAELGVTFTAKNIANNTLVACVIGKAARSQALAVYHHIRQVSQSAHNRIIVKVIKQTDDGRMMIDFVDAQFLGKRRRHYEAEDTIEVRAV